MNTSTNPLKDFLMATVAGSIVVQRARYLGQTNEDLANVDPKNLAQLSRDCSSFGIDFEVTADHLVTSLIHLYSAECNRENFITTISRVLWEILGDPESGSPPEIYKKAAFATWYALMLTLEPDLQADA